MVFPNIGFDNKRYSWRALSNLAFPKIGFDNKRYSWKALSNLAFPNIGFDNKRYSWRGLSNVVGSEKGSHVNSNSSNKHLHLRERVGCIRSLKRKQRKQEHKEFNNLMASNTAVKELLMFAKNRLIQVLQPQTLRTLS